MPPGGSLRTVIAIIETLAEPLDGRANCWGQVLLDERDDGYRVSTLTAPLR